MLLRDFQTYAPDADVEVNQALSVLSEVAWYWLMRQPNRVAPFSKLVVAVHGDDSWLGSDFIAWPGGVAEVRLTAHAMTNTWDEARDPAWAIASIVEGFRVGIAHGAGVDGEAVVTTLARALSAGPPFRERLDRLSFRDRATRDTFHVIHEFDRNSSRFDLVDEEGRQVSNIVAAESYLPQDAIFPVVRTKVIGRRVSFLTRSGSEYTWLDLPAA